MDVRRMGFDHQLFHPLHHILDFAAGDDKSSNSNASSRDFMRDAKAMAATPANVKEYPNSYAFVIDMPGMKSGNIQVQIDEDIHPTIGSDSLHKASTKAVEVITAMVVPVELSDPDSLVKSASMFSVVDAAKPEMVDLRDIKIVKKAKIAVIQFQISPPNTDIEQSIVVSKNG